MRFLFFIYILPFEHYDNLKILVDLHNLARLLWHFSYTGQLPRRSTLTTTLDFLSNSLLNMYSLNYALNFIMGSAKTELHA